MTKRLEQVLRDWKIAAGSNGDGLVFGEPSNPLVKSDMKGKAAP
jgi:hypothetical protein